MPTIRLVFARTFERTRSAVSSTRSIVVLNGGIDPLGFFLHLRADDLEVVQNRVDAGHRRRHLPLLEPVDERHDPLVDQITGDPDTDDHERFEHADRGHDAEHHVGCSEILHEQHLRRDSTGDATGYAFAWPRSPSASFNTLPALRGHTHAAIDRSAELHELAREILNRRLELPPQLAVRGR